MSDGAGLAEALAALRAGRVTAAEARARALLAKAPHDPALHQLAAVIALQRRDFATASRFASSCLALRPAHAPALIIAGRAARGEGDLDAALGFFRRAAALAPERPEPAFMTCVTLLEKGDPEAQAMPARLLRLFPNDADGWDELGLALQRAGRAEAALVAFTRAAKAGRNPAHMLHRAITLQGLGNAKEAAAAFTKALEIAPDLVDALLGLAAIEREAGAPDAARARLERAVALEPGNAGAWFALGLLREDLRDGDGAILAYRKAAELRPDFAEAQVNLGISQQREGDLAAALVAYRAAVKARPDSFGRIAQALSSAKTGQVWLDLRKLRRSLGG